MYCPCRLADISRKMMERDNNKMRNEPRDGEISIVRKNRYIISHEKKIQKRDLPLYEINLARVRAALRPWSRTFRGAFVLAFCELLWTGIFESGARFLAGVFELTGDSKLTWFCCS